MNLRKHAEELAGQLKLRRQQPREVQQGSWDEYVQKIQHAPKLWRQTSDTLREQMDLFLRELGDPQPDLRWIVSNNPDEAIIRSRKSPDTELRISFHQEICTLRCQAPGYSKTYRAVVENSKVEFSAGSTTVDPEQIAAETFDHLVKRMP